MVCVNYSSSCGRSYGGIIDSAITLQREDEYIVFNNKYIEKELQQILKKDKITQEDLDSLRTIDIEDNQEITEIADLAKCKKLTQLTIKNCKLNDISAIEEVK